MIGDKIYLRILEESDIAQTTEWINHPEIGEIMGYLPVKSYVAQLQWFKGVMNDNSRYIFAICDKQTKEHIGNAGLGNIDYISRHCMFNIFIVQGANRSRGLGTETAHLLLAFAFQKLNMNKVYLRTSERFVEANRMYQSLGFVQEGIMRQHYYTGGNYEDKIIYSMLRSEYHGK